MDRAKVAERLEQLTRQQEQSVAQTNALGGAIADCKFWLEQMPLEAVAPPKEEE